MKRITVTILLLIAAISLATCLTLSQKVEQPANKTTYVWFEGLSLIEGKDATSGMILQNGTYSTTLTNGENISITVDNGIWYFE